MTEPRIALLSRLEQAASSTEPDALRDALRWAIEELMEADLTAQSGSSSRWRGCRTSAARPRSGRSPSAGSPGRVAG